MTELELHIIRSNAIADFVNEQSVRYRKHSALAIEEDIALAIGWFGVPIDEFFEPEYVKNFENDASDFLLASITRLKAERIVYDNKLKNEEKN